MKACIDECQPNTSQANYSEGFWRITSKINAKIEVRKHLESVHANRRSPNSVPHVLETATISFPYLPSLRFSPSNSCLFWWILSANLCLLVSILGDLGAVSRAGRKGATKVFKHRRKSPWVLALTGPFLNGQENAGSWLGTKNALYYCAQLANSISWVLFVSSYTTALTRSRLVWLMHAAKKCTQSGIFQFESNRYISKYW